MASKPPAPPVYCPVCGCTLVATTRVIPAPYDMTSGKKGADTVVPTVACPRLMHPAYELLDGKTWTQRTP